MNRKLIASAILLCLFIGSWNTQYNWISRWDSQTETNSEIVQNNDNSIEDVIQNLKDEKDHEIIDEIKNIINPQSAGVQFGFTGNYSLPGIVSNIWIDNNIAYITGSSPDALYTVGINGTHGTLLDSITSNNSINDIVVDGDYAYLANQYNGLTVIDISDPAYLNEVCNLSVSTTQFCTGLFIEGNIAYTTIGAGGAGKGLYLFNISNPNKPSIISNWPAPNGPQNVYIDGDCAFVAVSGSGVSIVNVSNPAIPTLIKTLNVGGATVYDVKVDGDMAYLAAWSNGLICVDVSNLSNPIQIGSIPITNGNNVAIKGDLAFVSDGINGIRCIDIKNPWTPGLNYTYNTPNQPGEIWPTGDKLYVADGYSGLQIIQYAKPAQYDYGTGPGADDLTDVKVRGNAAFCTSSSGLLIYNITNPTSCILIGNYSTQNNATFVAIRGDVAFITDLNNITYAIDIANLSGPSYLGRYNFTDWILDIQIQGNLAFISAYRQGLVIINITNPRNMTKLTEYNPDGWVFRSYIWGDKAYLSTGLGLEVINITNPWDPKNIYSLISDTHLYYEYFFGTGSDIYYILEDHHVHKLYKLGYGSPSAIISSEFRSAQVEPGYLWMSTWQDDWTLALERYYFFNTSSMPIEPIINVTVEQEGEFAFQVVGKYMFKAMKTDGLIVSQVWCYEWEVPTAPQNLISIVRNGTITLNWSIPTSFGSTGELLGYMFYQRNGSSAWTMNWIGNVTGTALANLTAGLFYTFRVAGVNDIGFGAEVEIMNLSYVSPRSAPQSLTPTHGDHYITLTWSSPEDNGYAPICNYTLYRVFYTTPLNEYTKIVLGNVTTFTDTGLVNGYIYGYNITANNSEGESPYSISVFDVPQNYPSPPLNVQTHTGNEFVNITWDTPGDDGGFLVASYDIYRSQEANVGFVKIGTVLIPKMYYIDIGLSNGASYYYRVEAHNQVGYSPESDTVMGIPCTAPSAPGRLRSSISKPNVTLYWDKPQSDGGSPLLKYHIYRYEGLNETPMMIEITDTTTLKYTDSDLTPGVKYVYFMLAVNVAGEGASDSVEVLIPQETTNETTTETTEPTNPIIMNLIGGAVGGAVAGLILGIFSLFKKPKKELIPR